MTNFTPTPEQQAIIEAAKRGENMRIVALAGAAKSTTLQLVAKALPAPKAMGSLALAFNKKIQEELSPKLSPMQVKTLNGLGHAVLPTLVGGRVKVDGQKMTLLRKDRFREAPWVASAVASAAKLRGLVPSGLTGKHEGLVGLIPDDHLEWELICDDLDAPTACIPVARALLILSIQQSFEQGICDFDDQVYLPTLFGGTFPSAEVLMIDEAQDLSPLNHAMLRRIKHKQLIAVGDPLQSIYAFRGASTTAMQALKDDFQLTDYTLNTCFRCPRSVVREARRWAPQMQFPDWAIEGKVYEIAPTRETGTWDRTSLPEEVTILCRNNAPLIKLALRLAKREPVKFTNGRAATMLLSLLREVCSYKKHWSMAQIEGKLDAWLEKKIATEDEARHGSIIDKADSLRACMAVSKDYAGVEKTIEDLFQARDAKLCFSTGHGSKGLEWDHVVFLDEHLIPSKYAKSPGAKQQEQNLAYVITTRAKQSLGYASSADFNWSA